MKHIFIILITLTIISTVNAQEGNANSTKRLYINTANTDKPMEINAAFEYYSPNGSTSVIVPSVYLESAESASPMTKHIGKMLVYNLTDNATISKGLYYNNGEKWVRLDGPTKAKAKYSSGDIKYSAINEDHRGWYLLNGREVSTLPNEAQKAAIALGFRNNLPNATGRFLKAKEGNETLGAAVGSNSVKLSQNNLPNDVRVSGTTSQAGAHTHSYTDRAAGAQNRVFVRVNRGVNDGAAPNSSNNGTTGTSGNHSHTMTATYTGKNAPIAINPEAFHSNVFVYLGE